MRIRASAHLPFDFGYAFIGVLIRRRDLHRADLCLASWYEHAPVRLTDSTSCLCETANSNLQGSPERPVYEGTPRREGRTPVRDGDVSLRLLDVNTRRRRRSRRQVK